MPFFALGSDRPKTLGHRFCDLFSVSPRFEARECLPPHGDISLLASLKKRMEGVGLFCLIGQTRPRPPGQAILMLPRPHAAPGGVPRGAPLGDSFRF